MKVSFITSPRIKQKYPESIDKIFSILKELGYSHTCDFITDVDVKDFYTADVPTIKKDYKEMAGGIKKADVAIFEASMHSLAVGYLVHYALESGKPVIVLHLEDSPPFLFENIQNEKLLVIPYESTNLRENLKIALEDSKDQMDVRFNFFVSPKIVRFLDWVAKKKKMPRAVYLRRLIEEDMKRSKDFSEE